MSVLVPGARKILVVGGYVFTDLTRLKILHAGIASNDNSVFYDNTPGGTPAVYQVPVSKLFKAYAFRMIQYSASAATAGNKIYYSDNNPGTDSATAMTNAVGFISQVTGSNANDALGSYQMSGGSNAVKEGVLAGSAPASKYIVLSSVSTTRFGSVQLFGYEVDA